MIDRTIDNGGIQYMPQLAAYQQIICLSGGEIYSKAVLNYGDAMFVTSGGTAVETTINQCGYLEVFSGGIADSTTVNSAGVLSASGGGIADNTTVNSSGAVIVSGGGIASGTTVNTYGHMIIRSGGTGNGTTISNNSAALYLSSGGIANDTGISSGGEFHVSKGGYANNTVVDSYGMMFVGGTVNMTTLNKYSLLCVRSGGTAEDTAVKSYGSMYVSGGIVNSTCIYYKGQLHIGNGGTAGNTTVTSSGFLDVSSGGMLTGNLQIENGATVSAYQGAIIDFIVAKQAVPEEAFINDWSLISGRTDADYTITIKANQHNGTYVLAEGAAAFKNTVTVKTTAGATLGTLSVESQKMFDGVLYTLTRNNGNLSLIIADGTITNAQSDVDGNGISDVMFQWTGGDCQIGFWMNGSNNWQGTGTSQPEQWELLGNYDMDGNGNADQVMVGNVPGGAYIGYYKDGNTTADGWETIGYLTNPDGIVWHNVVGNLTGNAGRNSIVWHAPELGICGVWLDGTDEWVSIPGDFNAYWEFLGCGDFNGDGKDEILGKNRNILYSADIDGNLTSLGNAFDWEICAIGDFSADGIDDIVLFHAETGSVMKYENGRESQWSSLGQLDKNDWFVVGAGDYNGDQTDDLLVRQYSTGILGYYESGDMSRWVEMGRGIDMNWTVIA